MNKFISILTLFCFLAGLDVNAQELSYSGPVNNALADVKTIDPSVWAAFNNASSLTSHSSIGIGAAYQARFNIQELSTRAFTGVVPIKFGVLSAGVLQSGYSKSLLNRYGLSYSRSFGNSTSAFFQYNYVSHTIEANARSDGYFSAFGLTQKVTSEFNIALLITNPEQSKISYDNTTFNLPSSFCVGLMWSNNKWVKVLAEAEKELDLKPVYKGAVELAVNHFLLVRAGMKGEPVEFTFGSGFNWNKLNIDLGFRYHQQLGVTSAAGLSYIFNKKEK